MYRKIESEEIKVHKRLGYQYILDRSHPLASGNAGFVYYHRHMMSIHIGRWLTKEEIVHHIDENKSNNEITNLLILDKYEHGFLHHGVSTKALPLRKNGVLLLRRCILCNKEFKPNLQKSKFCSAECSSRSQIKTSFDREELEQLIWSFPYKIVGETLGYSDVGIKKRAKSLGCLLPPPYFHNKIKDLNKKLDLYEEALIAQR